MSGAGSPAPAGPARPGDRPPAVLMLEDGTTFWGTAFGVAGESFGEAVFNTAMTGYQETLTDPSYCRQIVAMTAPHIGNTGINDEDYESRRVWVSGFVIRDPSPVASNWRAARTLDDELRAQGITAIALSGTRALTLHLRERGAMRAAISSAAGVTGGAPGSAGPDGGGTTGTGGTEGAGGLLERILASPAMTGADLAREVSTPEPYVVQPPPGTPVRYRVAAVDLGIKAATPRNMAALGCEVTVLPAASPASEILATSPDGVFFSNGPGDPAACDYAVDAVRGVLAAGVPLFGICFGSQLLGRALGLGTYKLRFGHRGVNQPVQDLRTGKVQITSHNHGFAVAMPGSDAAAQADPARTPGQQPRPRQPREFGTDFGAAEVTHVNLNDGVVEGLALRDVPAFAVQYHPEAAPGPHDATGLFAEFCALMERTS